MQRFLRKGRQKMMDVVPNSLVGIHIYNFQLNHQHRRALTIGSHNDLFHKLNSTLNETKQQNKGREI